MYVSFTILGARKKVYGKYLPASEFVGIINTRQMNKTVLIKKKLNEGTDMML